MAIIHYLFFIQTIYLQLITINYKRSIIQNIFFLSIFLYFLSHIYPSFFPFLSFFFKNILSSFHHFFCHPIFCHSFFICPSFFFVFFLCLTNYHSSLSFYHSFHLSSFLILFLFLLFFFLSFFFCISTILFHHSSFVILFFWSFFHCKESKIKERRMMKRKE